MKKLEYFIKEIHPIDFLKHNDLDIISLIKKNFPKLKIISKGDRIIADGDNSMLLQLRIRLDTIVILIKENQNLDQKTIEAILRGNRDKLVNFFNGKVILYGVGKKTIK
ncbi:MAG: hypothetical protein CMC72_03960, partial [Flavobacteriaceae bacterium]|nr:hypothetical protein [Flavobacteriaceae bacterium]